MEKKIVAGTLLMAFLAVVAGCATMESAGHKYLMSGQILDVTDGTVYLCIGSKDGAEVGQELTVYKFERAVNPNPKYSAQPYFVKMKAGKIKIVEIVGEHMATAKVLTGEIKVNYVADLE